MSGKITYRDITEEDKKFLVDLYRSTRDDVMLYGGHMTPPQKDEFIRTQFSLQDNHYKSYYPTSTYQIIQLDFKDIGRLYLAEYDETVEVLDVILSPKYRGRGIGQEVMSAIIAKAEARGMNVRIYVQKNNRAFYFYQRLGFEAQDHEDGLHYQMSLELTKSKEIEYVSI